MTIKSQQGMSLIETIIVILLLALLSGVIILLITVPLKTYHDTQDRVELIQLGDVVLQRFSKEIKQAVPRSIRIDSTGQRIEFLHATHVGHYRAITEGSELALSFTDSSQTFYSLSPIDISAIKVGSGSQACRQAEADCLIIYHPDLFASHAYQGNIATVSQVEVNSGKTTISFDNSDLGGWHFTQPFSSFPHVQQLFYITDTAISYDCSTQLFMRYAQYPITATQPTVFSTDKGKRLADKISHCQFSLIPSEKGDIVKLSLHILSYRTYQRTELVQQILVPYPL